MRSVRNIVRRERSGGNHISLKRIFNRRNVTSLQTLVAALDIEDVYRQKGGQFGVGSPISFTAKNAAGTYVQNYQVGYAVKPLGGPPEFFTLYKASIQLAAVKCFGAEDDWSEEDEPYLIVSVFSVNPNFDGEDSLVMTKVIRANRIKPGDIFGQALTIGNISVVAGDGIRIHMALFEQEGGDPEEVKAAIERELREAVKKGAQALATAVAGGDIPLGGVGEKIGDHPITLFITSGLSSIIAPLIADDVLGEKVLHIPASELINIAIDPTDKSSRARFNSSVMTTPELGPGVRFNFPKDHFDRRWLFEGGGGSYKVYLKVTPLVEPKPII